MIEDGNSVTVEFTMKLDDGTIVDTNVDEDPLSYEQGAGELLPDLEKAMLGLSVGDTLEVKLTADQGYGAVDPDAYEEVELEVVPEDSRTAGTMIVATSPEGEEQPIRVHEVGGETITLDFNHPLAGQALHFEVKILAID